MVTGQRRRSTQTYSSVDFGNWNTWLLLFDDTAFSVWYPTHPSDFIQFRARYRFKISHRPFDSGQLSPSPTSLTHSLLINQDSASPLAMLSFTSTSFQFPFILFFILWSWFCTSSGWNWSFRKLLDQSFIFYFLLSRIGCRGLALEPTSIMLPWGLGTWREVNIPAPGGGNWSALGHSVSQYIKTRDSTRGSILSHEGHFQTELLLANLQLDECTPFQTCWREAGFITFIEAFTAARNTRKYKESLTLLIFCRLVVGRAARVL